MRIELNTRFELGEEVWAMVENRPEPCIVNDIAFHAYAEQRMNPDEEGLWYYVECRRRDIRFRSREYNLAKSRDELRDMVFQDFVQG